MMIFRASLLALTLGLGPAAQAQIEVQSLDALDPLEVGLSDAVFGVGLWDGSNAALARAALQALPPSDAENEADNHSGDYASDAARELARAVLASGGYPPAGGRGDRALASLRADRLLAAGGAADAFDLLERTPNINRMPELAALHAELAFALGEPGRACSTANALIEGRDSADWLRIRAFCLALDGQSAAAELTAELARSQSADAAFESLLFAITLGQVANDQPINSGLMLAMARNARMENLALTETAPAWLGDVLAAQLAREQRPSEDPAAELAAARGLPADARAPLLEAVLAQGLDRELAAEALALLLADARAAGRLAHADHEYGYEVSTLPITAATLQYGPDFVMAALVAGDGRTARQWRRALDMGPPPRPVPATVGAVDAAPVPTEPVAYVPPAADVLARLDLALALHNGQVRQPGIAEAVAAYAAAYGEAVLGEVLALQRLGVPASAMMREQVWQVEAMDGSAQRVLLAMEEAALAGGEAEAALLAASILAMPRETLSPDMLARTASVLSAIGLEDAMYAWLLEAVAGRPL